VNGNQTTKTLFASMFICVHPWLKFFPSAWNSHPRDLNLKQLWIDANDQGKRKVQFGICPNGALFDGEKVGTAEKPLLFRMLNQEIDEKSNLATLPGIEPGLLP
jgi:hypothetical protein